MDRARRPARSICRAHHSETTDGHLARGVWRDRIHNLYRNRILFNSATAVSSWRRRGDLTCSCGGRRRQDWSAALWRFAAGVEGESW